MWCAEPAGATAVPSSQCDFQEASGINGQDLRRVSVDSKELCCALCKAQPGCGGAVFSEETCHLKAKFAPVSNRTGSIAIAPAGAAYIV